MIVIIDYGLGNLGSVWNMLRRVSPSAVMSSDPSVIVKADKLVLPGVGAFDEGIRNLVARGLLGLLERRVVQDRVPALGICLGMQLMAQSSEEGSLPGLGWLDAEVVRFKFSEEQGYLKIPHMGWSEITLQKEHPLFRGAEEGFRFYFVHSYHFRCRQTEDIVATCQHGYDFIAAVAHDNIIGVQFHPEKSHRFGLKVLKNFVEM
jgi:glutamine amidotransferase